MKNLLNKWRLFTESYGQLPLGARDFFKDLAKLDIKPNDFVSKGVKKSDLIDLLEDSYRKRGVPFGVRPSRTAIDRFLQKLVQKGLIATQSLTGPRLGDIDTLIKLTSNAYVDYSQLHR